MLTLGTKLIRLRENKKLTREEMAIEIEVSKVAYGKWESDLAKPNIDNFMRLCKYHEIEPYDLLEEVKGVNLNKVKETRTSLYPNNSNINYHTLPELMNFLLNNQEKITKLIDVQNQLLAKILDVRS